jgi:hypothetical protein
MPWLIKSRGRLLHLRDGEGPSAPVFLVDGARWYPFANLPPHTDPLADGDVECRKVDSIDDVELAPVLAKQANPPEGSTPAGPVVVQQKKRKNRVR